VCHPRKQWPAYFTLSVNEMRNAEGLGGRDNNVDQEAPSHEMAPMLVGLISDELLFSRYCDDLESKEEVGS
jgi:hypothetical protein